MISIVVPIFNEEELVRLFHSAVADAMNEVGENLGSSLCKRWLQGLLP